MRLIIQGDRIAGAATDEYVGPDPWIDAPEGFDVARIDAYRLVDGNLSLVPQAVNPWQAKRALLEAGLLDQVEAKIADLPDDLEGRLVRLDWTTAQTFRRDWPALQVLATDLGRDSGDLDALFIHAATL